MRRSIGILFLLAVVILAGFYFWQQSKPTDSSGHLSLGRSQPTSLTDTDTDVPQKSSDTDTGTSSSSETEAGFQPQETSSTSPVEVSLQHLTAPQLRSWLANESRSMNSTGLEANSIQVRLTAQAQTLTSEQLKTLAQLARQSDLPANDRILAAYMLNLNRSEDSVAAMYDLSAQSITDHGPSVPHSESELRNAQELALRYMQIDELFQRAKTNANARDKLKLLSERAESSQVRSYAERKLKELK